MRRSAGSRWTGLWWRRSGGRLASHRSRAGQLCNDAVLREQDGEWQMEGDPTEGALLTLAVKAGLDPAAETAQFRRTDSIPLNHNTGSWRPCITIIMGMASFTSRVRQNEF
ncbi:MAG: hypothetical protein IPL59_26730 [Candidatus Competibacteraceae bacterium]|nr:hypothetical protein [Candidatus Competibacteraceae bacterium]